MACGAGGAIPLSATRSDILTCFTAENEQWTQIHNMKGANILLELEESAGGAGGAGAAGAAGAAGGALTCGFALPSTSIWRPATSEGGIPCIEGSMMET